MHAPTRTTVDLNRACRSFDAVAGLDDLTPGGGSAVFSVQGGDGSTLWRSGELRAGEPPVPVHASLVGQSTVRLVVTRVRGAAPGVVVADWANARFGCV